VRAPAPTHRGSRLRDAVAVAGLVVVGELGDARARGPGAEVEQRETRSSGSAMPRSKACMRDETLLSSPSSVAPTSLPSRTITVL
jgi:hypothetical protein